MTFYGNIDEHKWESFTLIMHDRVLLDRIVDYTGNQPGTGALMTWIESGWHLSIVVPHQPYFPHMPENSYTVWGYGFEIDHDGDYVAKPMSGATGREILTELVHQLGFDDILDHILATTEITTAMMPYASSLFAARAPGDRPLVVPVGSANFAFLGQFTELPEDVVFTVEYSVHGAMYAVDTLLGVGRLIPPDPCAEAEQCGLRATGVGLNPGFRHMTNSLREPIGSPWQGEAGPDQAGQSGWMDGQRRSASVTRSPGR